MTEWGDGLKDRDQHWFEVAHRLAGYIDQLMDGDTHQIDDMMEFLKEHHFVDEDGFFINQEED